VRACFLLYFIFNSYFISCYQDWVRFWKYIFTYSGYTCHPILYSFLLYW